jgi:hypothetical protein
MTYYTSVIDIFSNRVLKNGSSVCDESTQSQIYINFSYGLSFTIEYNSKWYLSKILHVEIVCQNICFSDLWTASHEKLLCLSTERIQLGLKETNGIRTHNVCGDRNILHI